MGSSKFDNHTRPSGSLLHNYFLNRGCSDNCLKHPELNHCQSGESFSLFLTSRLLGRLLSSSSLSSRLANCYRRVRSQVDLDKRWRSYLTGRRQIRHEQRGRCSWRLLRWPSDEPHAGKERTTSLRRRWRPDSWRLLYWASGEPSQ